MITSLLQPTAVRSYRVVSTVAALCTYLRRRIDWFAIFCYDTFIYAVKSD